MKKLGLFIAACLLLCIPSAAQNNILKSLQTDVPGQGKVTIHQDARIAELIGSTHTPDETTGEEKIIKSTGYRVQLYAGNNTRQAKNEAHKVAEEVKETFPDLKVYTSFNPPRWLCRVGDYRSIEEADAMMRQLRATGQFKEVSIVKDQINIHY